MESRSPVFLLCLVTWYDLDTRHDAAQTSRRTCRALLTHMLSAVELPGLPTSLRAWDGPWTATVSQSKPFLSVLTIWDVCYRKEKLNTLTKLNHKAWIESFQPFLETLNKDGPLTALNLPVTAVYTKQFCIFRTSYLNWSSSPPSRNQIWYNPLGTCDFENTQPQKGDGIGSWEYYTMQFLLSLLQIVGSVSSYELSLFKDEMVILIIIFQIIGIPH